MTRDGWHQVVTAFPKAETTVVYRYETGEWCIPDPHYNEASLVGARIEPLYTQGEVDALIERDRQSASGRAE
jgi:hypothetical protein